MALTFVNAGVGHRRRGGGHVDRVDADPVGGVVDGGVAGQAGDRVLAGRVGGIAPEAGEGGDRPDVDHRAAVALGQHLAQLVAQRLEHAGDIHGEALVPVGVRGRVDRGEDEVALAGDVDLGVRRHAVHHAGGVQGEVDASVARDCRLDHALAVGVGAHIGVDEDRLTACLGDELRSSPGPPRRGCRRPPPGRPRAPHAGRPRGRSPGLPPVMIRLRPANRPGKVVSGSVAGMSRPAGVTGLWVVVIWLSSPEVGVCGGAMGYRRTVGRRHWTGRGSCLAPGRGLTTASGTAVQPRPASCRR